MKRNLINGMAAAALCAAFAVSAMLPGYAGAASSATPESGAALLLESIRQNYLASVRLNALKGKKISTPAAGDSWLTRVNAGEVNMAANRFEKKAQKAVNINGHTYFVANDAGATHITHNPSTRFATDPATGKSIDKAEAAIFADASGRAFYFESEATARAFLSLAEKKFAGTSPVIQ